MELLRHRLKIERKRLKLTQGQLAAMVDKNMGQSFISNLETGEREETPFIAELAHALGVDAYWLKTGKGARTGGVTLTEDESLLLRALPLLDPGTKRSWVLTAQDVINQHEASRQNAA